MAALDSLEKSLEGIFVKNAPALPERGKEVVVSWLPWINLILGILTLWAVLTLWHWAHLANNAVDYINQLNATYGTGTVVHKLTGMVWLGLIVLAIEAVLYLMAFPATRARQKSGWNLMFYALLVNLVYGIIVLFTDYGGFGTFLSYLLGSVIGLWLLFQIRGKYLGSHRMPSA
jgi:hypothetical protein